MGYYISIPQDNVMICDLPPILCSTPNVSQPTVEVLPVLGPLVMRAN